MSSKSKDNPNSVHFWKPPEFLLTLLSTQTCQIWQEKELIVLSAFANNQTGPVGMIFPHVTIEIGNIW